MRASAMYRSGRSSQIRSTTTTSRGSRPNQSIPMFRRPTVAIKMETQLDGHTALLLSARGAHLRRDWLTSYESFARANQAAPLGTDDLDALAAAAWRLGRCKESVRYSEQVFKQLSRSDPTAAAMKAVDVALAWLTRGDLNIGQGWMNRARRLLEGGTGLPDHRLPRLPRRITSRHAPETPMGSSGRSTTLREIVRAARHSRDDVPLSGRRGPRRDR